MRLLHSTSYELVDFIGDAVPPYAIMSHTWGSEEVSHGDMYQPDHEQLKGFAKIRACCAQAARDDLDWVWIDTCCIDKSSSAELSEAVNSMYQWYKKADVCYVYLYDVPPSDPFLDHHLFQNARWFTRGWCLQELIAPREVEFYAQDWSELGTKWSLQEAISGVTSIPADFLLQDRSLEQFSVAQRMSWASKRNTTREEDMAYCLLGIFDINMPLMYGEGRRAFIRLQQEIMRREVDYTIFLWRAANFHDMTGLLCDSPHCFPINGVPIRTGGLCKYSDIVASQIVIKGILQHARPPEVTPRGLQMTVHTKKLPNGSRLAWIYLTHNDGLVCVPLSPLEDDNKYYRVDMGCVQIVNTEKNLDEFRAEDLQMAVFTDLSVPSIPVRALDFKLWLKSTPDEHLSILDIYPECHLQKEDDGLYATQLDLATCPEFFVMVFGVEKTGSMVHRFVAAFSLFHGPWACKIRKFIPDAPLDAVAETIWKLGPLEDESDRAISLLPTGSYVSVAAKRRTRSSKCHLYISLIPANPSWRIDNRQRR